MRDATTEARGSSKRRAEDELAAFHPKVARTRPSSAADHGPTARKHPWRVYRPPLRYPGHALNGVGKDFHSLPYPLTLLPKSSWRRLHDIDPSGDADSHYVCRHCNKDQGEPNAHKRKLFLVAERLCWGFGASSTSIKEENEMLLWQVNYSLGITDPFVEPSEQKPGGTHSQHNEWYPFVSQYEMKAAMTLVSKPDTISDNSFQSWLAILDACGADDLEKPERPALADRDVNSSTTIIEPVNGRVVVGDRSMGISSYRKLSDLYTLLDKIERTSIVGSLYLDAYADHLRNDICRDCWFKHLVNPVISEKDHAALLVHQDQVVTAATLTTSRVMVPAPAPERPVFGPISNVVASTISTSTPQPHDTTPGSSLAATSAGIPTGRPNCLTGLAFHFTGGLRNLGRQDGQALVEHYGGRVTTVPNTTTNYEVIGDDPDWRKLQRIETKGPKTIDEHGLYELIRGRSFNGGGNKSDSSPFARPSRPPMLASGHVDNTSPASISTRHHTPCAQFSAPPRLSSNQNDRSSTQTVSVLQSSQSKSLGQEIATGAIPSDMPAAQATCSGPSMPSAGMTAAAKARSLIQAGASTHAGPSNHAGLSNQGAVSLQAPQPAQSVLMNGAKQQCGTDVQNAPLNNQERSASKSLKDCHCGQMLLASISRARSHIPAADLSAQDNLSKATRRGWNQKGAATQILDDVEAGIRLDLLLNTYNVPNTAREQVKTYVELCGPRSPHEQIMTLQQIMTIHKNCTNCSRLTAPEFVVQIEANDNVQNGAVQKGLSTQTVQATQAAHPGLTTWNGPGSGPRYRDSSGGLTKIIPLGADISVQDPASIASRRGWNHRGSANQIKDDFIAGNPIHDLLDINHVPKYAEAQVRTDLENCSPKDFEKAMTIQCISAAHQGCTKCPKPAVTDETVHPNQQNDRAAQRTPHMSNTINFASQLPTMPNTVVPIPRSNTVSYTQQPRTIRKAVNHSNKADAPAAPQGLNLSVITPSSIASLAFQIPSEDHVPSSRSFEAPVSSSKALEAAVLGSAPPEAPVSPSRPLNCASQRKTIAARNHRPVFDLAEGVLEVLSGTVQRFDIPVFSDLVNRIAENLTVRDAVERIAARKEDEDAVLLFCRHANLAWDAYCRSASPASIKDFWKIPSGVSVIGKSKDQLMIEAIDMKSKEWLEAMRRKGNSVNSGSCVSPSVLAEQNPEAQWTNEVSTAELESAVRNFPRSKGDIENAADSVQSWEPEVAKDLQVTRDALRARKALNVVNTGSGQKFPPRRPLSITVPDRVDSASPNDVAGSREQSSVLPMGPPSVSVPKSVRQPSRGAHDEPQQSDKQEVPRKLTLKERLEAHKRQGRTSGAGSSNPRSSSPMQPTSTQQRAIAKSSGQTMHSCTAGSQPPASSAPPGPVQSTVFNPPAAPPSTARQSSTRMELAAKFDFLNLPPPQSPQLKQKPSPLAKPPRTRTATCKPPSSTQPEPVPKKEPAPARSQWYAARTSGPDGGTSSNPIMFDSPSPPPMAKRAPLKFAPVGNGKDGGSTKTGKKRGRDSGDLLPPSTARW